MFFKINYDDFCIDSGTAGNVHLSLHERNAITDPFIIDTMAFGLRVIVSFLTTAAEMLF